MDDLSDGALTFVQAYNPAAVTALLQAPVRQAAVIVRASLWDELDEEAVAAFTMANALIVTSDSPRALFSGLVCMAVPLEHNLLRPPRLSGGPEGARMAPDAVVAPTAQLGSGCVVGTGAVIGENAVIGPECVIGERAMVFDGVRLGARVTLGPGALVGTRVNAFEPVEDGSGWHDFPQTGGLIVGDDVRIGAYAVINGGTSGDTLVGDHGRIGDYVVIAHNCRLEEGVAVLTGSIVGGSVKIGARVWIGLGCAINNKVEIGAEAVIGTGCSVVMDVDAGARLIPAPVLTQEELLRLRRLLLGRERRG
jgi:UDP-3-O-[3-hydroxymyristoyl] glucosamine N-acyltransferase LpxD